MSDAQKVRHYRKYLRELVASVESHIKAFDEIAKRPQSEERGKSLGRVMSSLELQKDIAKRHGLEASFASSQRQD